MNNIYFLGIGGIGMSALARYFMHEGRRVAGYDRTRTPLTIALEQEGAAVHYYDVAPHKGAADAPAALIPAEFRDPATTLVVYTPAVPADHPEMEWLREHGFRMLKRSQMLGEIARGKFVMAVAGTHGKTSTTTLTAWLNNAVGNTRQSGEAKTTQADAQLHGSAFMGGISKNFDSNLVLGNGNRLAVEADEFDRSFLTLHPDVAVITSTDPDHLDIYGTPEAMRETFAQFARQVRGALIVKHDAVLELPEGIPVWYYGLETGDMHAANISLREGGYYDFDIVLPDRVLRDCTLGIPGIVNVENAVAAVAMQWSASIAELRVGSEELGVLRDGGLDKKAVGELDNDVVGRFDEDAIRHALATFAGVRRRFDFWINTPQRVYMDDYAHHPRELAAAIGSLRGMFPGRKLTAVFQPHLFTRTRDFHREFGAALSLADEVILCPVYPARELPLPGITSELIGASVTVPWSLVERDDVPAELRRRQPDVVATFGAGDIENICPAVAEALGACLPSANADRSERNGGGILRAR